MNPFDAALPALQEAAARRATRVDTGPVVHLSGVSKRYESVQALDNVSLDIGQGQVVALLGPNGAGKSTLVEIIMGLRQADSGSVNIFGDDVRGGQRGYLSRIGVQLQTTGFFPSLSGRDYLKFFQGVYPHTLPLDRVIELLDLSAFVDKTMRGMSGGQRQRIALALAIVNDPDFIILDEPTVGLDPIARREFWDILRQLHGGTRTLLFSTHYMEEVQALADRVVMMAKGRVIASGTVDDVIAAAGPEARNLDDAYNILLAQRKGAPK
ncbi:ABC transporter ATP-binding protein [Massilia arenosa]|uniref:ABC transporter ATP-binding protein n=1 Tax=Zemynaea arenosa TaxID=2561931 RepID=A0A4Y9S8W6_9BURK|nr:ABC transporter ATP-binding protein [Massilia arenosa]TFW16937.1 ABC transporter ATP-binding protein [Massilia arenosa]